MASEPSAIEKFPAVPLRDFVVFPYMTLPIFAAREASISAIEEAYDGDRQLVLVAQRDPEDDEPGKDGLSEMGTVAMVMRVQRLPDGRVKALVQGLARFRIDAVEIDDGIFWTTGESIQEDETRTTTVEEEAILRTVGEHVQELLPLKNLPPEISAIMENVQQPGRVADLVASHLMLQVPDAQSVLEDADPVARLQRVDGFLRRELEISNVQAEINAQVQEEMSRSQRDHYLREQIRAIRAELGDVEDTEEEVDEYRVKLEEAGLSEEAEEEANRQLRRLERMHPDGPEAQVVRTYLDWLVALPWSKSSPDTLDLKEAREVLDADHAHLEKIKERILEHLGVCKLKEDFRGPILCFSGPPGVGKTSLGRSIARSMGREFVRVSLGGVHDESEIRGHRRTYVGALPGRIIQGLRQAGTNNPVMMLDELDKLGNDFRGDPSAALLEVLDPEQNHSFSDHYLNVAFDLSKVLFIATANQLEPIPAPLRDRMEVIPLSGYTPEEKLQIAETFLFPKQLETHGIPEGRLSWSPGSLRKIVTDYTYEAGVRNLDRKIATVCRKVALKEAEGDDSQVKLSCRNLPRYLGSPPFIQEKLSKENEIGVVNGLAWTQAGGDVLWLEATLTRGKGIVLTGQLGDVMKESGQAALTYARGWAAEQSAEKVNLDKHEVHVHFPAGAIPKDGPSAGITIATALVSLATEIPVRSDVAMTGEVTLRGKVLPIGGLREKCMAALRSGITTVIFPESNVQDLKDIPEELRRKMTFIPVSHMEEVLKAALTLDPTAKKRPKRAAGAKPRSRSAATARSRR
ncbi:MAG: endopeptidase La [Deltaproteobacteria bacterium]|nr:endopeptidase La [Deltaproteobacteria bacterium]